MQLINYVSLRPHIRLSAAGDHAITWLLLLLSFGSSISLEFDLPPRMMSQHTRCPNKGLFNNRSVSKLQTPFTENSAMARIRDILRGWGPADPQNILKRDSWFSQWVVIELGGSSIQWDNPTKVSGITWRCFNKNRRLYYLLIHGDNNTSNRFILSVWQVR